MNKIYLIIGACLCLVMNLQAQVVAVKTNLLSDATTTPSLGAEVGLGTHFSIDLTGTYNPWEFSKGKSLQHWMVQPEGRYWIHERFNGHYFGLHALYMDYDFAGFKLPFGMHADNAYKGNAYGGGISYGYQLYLSPRWNIEFTAGFGYLNFEYDKYTFGVPRKEGRLGKFRTEYWGVTKAGISIVYIIK